MHRQLSAKAAEVGGLYTAVVCLDSASEVAMRALDCVETWEKKSDGGRSRPASAPPPHRRVTETNVAYPSAFSPGVEIGRSPLQSHPCVSSFFFASRPRLHPGLGRPLLDTEAETDWTTFLVPPLVQAETASHLQRAPSRRAFG